MDTNLILILAGLVLIFVSGLILIFFLSSKTLKVSIKQKQDIINTKPKRIVEYLDAFFFNNTSNNDIGDWFQVYYVVKDIKTKEIFVIDEVNSEGIRLELMHDKVRVITKNNEINFGDRGFLWIDESVKSNMNFNSKIRYGGCAKDSNFKGINKRYVVYNTNKEYDLSLLENAKKVFGVLSFKE